jgi:ubiquinone/menaquinone biosynthesis C-methylase UbiE
MLSTIKKFVPKSIKHEIRSALLRRKSTRDYETLYEDHARELSPGSSIGNGDFDLIGRLELALLTEAGMTATSTLVDFGCGTGRLAVHAVPALNKGKYVGIDISQTMLAHCRTAIGSAEAEVVLQHQTEENFALGDASVDYICAFSVFTHMEHEDTYRYLRSARRIVRDGGAFVASCLPMTLSEARRIFLDEANLDSVARWGHVRNITTTKEMMEVVATMAGWRVDRWYDGDQENIIDPATGKRHGLGQSTLVLRPA